ncbi:helix-turn-helix transcriptional regulator [Kitasatospora sp. NPDC002227]|uniref:helix-turn-helix domain-containing protein n=1 Tax=Kitasatospora sp. NPDC002227 TaxID=3154773 RepID=UPI0033257E93
MAVPSGPVQHRRQVGRRLKELRETSGLTTEQAGAAIQRSDSTMSRIENGKRNVQLIELKGLLDAYEVSAEVRSELLALARSAPEGGLWTAFEAAFPPDMETYLGLEEGSSTLRVFSLSTVHSLLRTRKSLTGIIRAGLPTAGADEVDRLVEAHLARQRVLAREPDPVELQVVLDEAALRRPAGGVEAMREQLDHLVHCAENVPNVTLQVLPFSKGSHGSPSGGFTLMGFPDPSEPEVVYCDTIGGNLYLHRPQEVRRFTQLFGRLCGAALDPAESVEFLRSFRQEM